MNVRRGDAVLLDAPFLHRPGSKVRPMLVVQNDANNQRMLNTIVATITTTTKRSDQPTQVIVDLDTPDGRDSGLLATSVVSCENVLTVRRDRVIKVIGRLSPALMQHVDAAIKVSMGLL